jgi:hypothetical protein
VTSASLSYDISAAGVVSAYTWTGIDSINDGVIQAWDYSGNYGGTLAPASATYTGPGLTLTYVAGSGVICPGPPAVGNLTTGVCGQLATGTLLPNPYITPGDLGSGIIGWFPVTPGLATEQFTLAQAQFGVTSIPEPPPIVPEPPPIVPEPPPIIPEPPPIIPEPPPVIPEPTSSVLFLSGLVLVGWYLQRARVSC